MGWFSVRISGGFFLVIQAILLQLLWGPAEEISLAEPASLTFGILTGLTLLAVIGFLLLNYIGWLLAMMIQGACLFAALAIHFQSPALYAQITMFYSILMVLYLNSFMVRTAFGRRLEDQNDTGEEE